MAPLVPLRRPGKLRLGTLLAFSLLTCPSAFVLQGSGSGWHRCRTSSPAVNAANRAAAARAAASRMTAEGRSPTGGAAVWTKRAQEEPLEPARQGSDMSAAAEDRRPHVGTTSLAQPAATRVTIPTKVPVVGKPQVVVEKEYSIDAILKELAEIQRQGPKNYCILGSRHCSFLHQQIIELLAYALVLSGNHVFTSGAGGTNAATIRGALRAERPDLLTVVLPQSLVKQSGESQELLKQVQNVIDAPQNDHLPLDVASRLCNSDLLSRADQLICFAFHDSNTIIETSKEARALDMIVTELYLD